MSFVPVATAEDLGIYLADTTINVARAQQLIEFSQQLCETVVSPIPDNAVGIVMRVAGRAYGSITAARQEQLGNADAAFGATPGPVGGVYLTATDEADLLRFAEEDPAATVGGAFSINMLPAGYSGVSQLPQWDVNVDPDVATS